MICPCCKQPVESFSKEALLEIVTGKARRPLFERFANTPLSVVSTESLIEACWPTPEDEPENTLNGLRKTVQRVNDLITPYGWHIVNLSAVGYRLEPINAPSHKY